MNVIEAIRSKRAVREYSDEPIAEDVAAAILHAGRRAQSAKNTQPWHFIAIRDRSVLRALAGTSPNVRHVAGSTLTVAIVTPPPSEKETILFDAGQAAAYMQLAAWELGVVSCLGTIYELQEARRILRIPPERHLHVVVAFGYPLDGAGTQRPARKGGRRSLAEVVHWNHW